MNPPDRPGHYSGESPHITDEDQRSYTEYGSRIRAIYSALYMAYGPQGWWPGDTPIEVMIGAILTQNTSWTNVEKAIRNMKREKILSAGAIARCDRRTLARLIRPSGYYNIKAGRLKNYARFLMRRFGGSVRRMRRLGDIPGLRRDLLLVNGIGFETADSILLYALNKPVFVVDAYTKRIFSRHGFFGHDAPYEDVRKLFMSCLPKDAALYNEYHALIVKLGKDVCRKNSPGCRDCPLSGDIGINARIKPKKRKAKIMSCF